MDDDPALRTMLWAIAIRTLKSSGEQGFSHGHHWARQQKNRSRVQTVMGTSSRKRKSHEFEADSAAGTEDAQAALRRHFESQFTPLEPAVAALLIKPGEDDDAPLPDEESDNSVWDGFSEDEEGNLPL
jgi:hypothetical protein